MIKIYNHSKFKNTRYYRKMTNSVAVNYHGYSGFIELAQYELDKGDKIKDIILQGLEVRGITKGTIVYYRAKDGWGLGVYVVFYSENIINL